MTVLAIRGLRSGYGKIEVLHDVDLTIERGQIVTLIGANGAGKTTLLKTISGLIRPTARHDRVRRQKHRAAAAAQDRRARLQPGAGRPRYPQAHDRARQPAHGGFHAQRFADRPRHRRGVSSAFRRWRSGAQQMAATLSGGEQQMLAIGRALMARPSAVAAGRAFARTRAQDSITRIFLTLRELKKEGKTILLVEQNARQALQVADRGYVMERGTDRSERVRPGASEHAGGAAHLSRATRCMNGAASSRSHGSAMSGVPANMVAIREVHVAQERERY